MRVLDRIGLVVFANLILIISVIFCLLIFGWLSPNAVYEAIKTVLNNPFSTNVILVLSIFSILLAIKCIFFSTDKDTINGIKDGILLQNEEGQLVISKSTLEELVNKIARGFESAQDVTSKIIVDKEKNLIVYVTLKNVKENVIMKELSNNLQVKIKSAIKNTSDLEVKEVNVNIKQLQQTEKIDLIEK